MPIEIQCTTCSYRVHVKSKYAGKRVRCPKCQSRIEVPQPSDSKNVVDEMSLPPSPPPPPAPPQAKQRQLSPEPPPRPVPTSRKHKRPAWLLVSVGGVAALLLVLAVYAAYTMGIRSRRPATTPAGQPIVAGVETHVTSPSPVPQITEPAQREDYSPSLPSERSDVSHDVPAAPTDKTSSVPDAESSSPDAEVTVPGTASPNLEPNPPAPDAEQPPLKSPAATTESQTSTATVAVAEEETTPPPPTIAVFKPLPLENPATSMAMAEDGRYLVLSHQTANQITIYDVLQHDVVATLTTVAPRCILCRGDKVFVSNRGQGTISVFAYKEGWKQVNQLKVLKPNIVHLSAPGGENFSDELLVTCHGDGEAAPSLDSQVFVVDVKKDRCRPIARPPLASVSHDGRLVMTQDSFRTSPSGMMTVFNYREYVAASSKTQPVMRGDPLRTPFVYQVASGSYWIGNDVVYGGVPLSELKRDLGRLIVPDLSERTIYALTENLLTAHRLDVTFTEIGMREAVFPQPPEQFHEVYQLLSRRRDYLLDHPVAYTHGDRLFLFVLTASGGMLLAADTPAFTGKAAPPFAAGNDVATSSETPSGGQSDRAMPGADPASISGLLERFPSRIVAGKLFQFSFPIPQQTSIELMSQLAGLTLTPKGELRWTPTADQVGVHELKIRVEQGGGTVFLRPTLEVIDEELAASVRGDLSALDSFQRLELAVDRYAISDSFDRAQTLLLQGDTLRVLGDDGITVADTRQLPNRYDFIEDRRDAYVAVTRNPEPVLHVVDRRSLEIRQEIRLTTDETQVLEITDLAINPTGPVSYVAIKCAVELPRYTVLTVDEQSGRVQAPGILGTWVEVSPDGKRLYTGYKDIYDRGSTFHINPDWRLIEIPEYGNVDMLISWSIGSRPRLRQVIRQAGGNGNGIRLSSDGQRVSYLSFVGTPMHSKNLQGWNARELGDPPVNYETKDRAVTTELAFHPWLPLVAVPGGGAAILFHRETGELLENKLLIPSGGLGDVQVERLFFSPNGRNLLFVCSAGALGRYLRAVPLKLTQQELASRVNPRLRAPNSGESTPRKVPRTQLAALDPLRTRESLTARDIGQKYLDAVVSVLTDNTSGTGFFIGSTGYLLTSAHIVEDADSVEVVYNSKPGAKDYAPLKVPAEVIRSDDTLDLALLKIESTIDLVHVHFASDEPVETGESVTVIGDPGLGDQILNRTMTTGIVSNPNREIDGQPYVQISAAVNPGNSGGPLFNENGFVIGLISLKGNIEGAGFAVPTSLLKTFLQQAVDGK